MISNIKKYKKKCFSWIKSQEEWHPFWFDLTCNRTRDELMVLFKCASQYNVVWISYKVVEHGELWMPCYPRDKIITSFPLAVSCHLRTLNTCSGLAGWNISRTMCSVWAVRNVHGRLWKQFVWNLQQGSGSRRVKSSTGCDLFTSTSPTEGFEWLVSIVFA